MQKKESNSSQQSIERALKLLNIMADNRTALTVTEISRLLNISRSTAYAMLNVMTEMNYLSRDPETGKYFLGYQVFILGSRARIRYSHLLACDTLLVNILPQISVPFNTINIMVLEQDYKVLRFITKWPSLLASSSNQFSQQRVHPCYCTASGRILISEFPEEEQRKILESQNLYAYTSSTVTDIDQLTDILKKIPKQGYTVEVEEYANFEINTAAPIRDYSGKIVAAVNICASKLVYQNRTQEYTQLLLALSQEMSSLLGYQGHMA